jgi:hypothetical protein
MHRVGCMMLLGDPSCEVSLFHCREGHHQPETGSEGKDVDNVLE